jgi:hypothetical protein
MAGVIKLCMYGVCFCIVAIVSFGTVWAIFMYIGNGGLWKDNRVNNYTQKVDVGTTPKGQQVLIHHNTTYNTGRTIITVRLGAKGTFCGECDYSFTCLTEEGYKVHFKDYWTLANEHVQLVSDCGDIGAHVEFSDTWEKCVLDMKSDYCNISGFVDLWNGTPDNSYSVNIGVSVVFSVLITAGILLGLGLLLNVDQYRFL